MGEELFPLKAGGFVKLSPQETSLCGNCYFKPGGPGTNCVCDRDKFADNKSVACGTQIFKYVEVAKPEPAKSIDFSESEYVKVPCSSCSGCVFSDNGCSKPNHFSYCNGSANNGVSMMFKLKSDYVIPEPESCKESDYVKIEHSDCFGCVFGNGIHNCKRPISFSGCGSIVNNGKSIIYKLKSDYVLDYEPTKEEPVAQDPNEYISDGVAYRRVPDSTPGTCDECSFWSRSHGSGCRHNHLRPECIETQTIFKPACTSSNAKVDSTPPNQEIYLGKYVKVPEKVHGSCEGCALYNIDHLACPKGCEDDHVIYHRLSTTVDEEEEGSAYPTIGNTFTTKDGEKVIVCKEIAICQECYFKRTGECTQIAELGRDIVCGGIIFKLESEVDSFAEDEILPDDYEEEVVDDLIGKKLFFIDGQVTVAESKGDSCCGCYFDAGSGCKKPSELPNCTNRIFTNFVAYNRAVKTEITAPEFEEEENKEIPLGGVTTFDDGKTFVKAIVGETPGWCYGCCFVDKGCPGTKTFCGKNNVFIYADKPLVQNSYKDLILIEKESKELEFLQVTKIEI